jgi:sRNA-binding carbon storage regulator CsrA
MAGKLVLTIRENDWFVVGDAVIKIERIKGPAAKVSIQAPKSIKILRGKLVEEQRDADKM